MRDRCGSLMPHDIIIKSESKADDKYPVVSAASIVAKVSRDELLAQWVFKEAVSNEIQFDHDFGCGYPSDPKSKIWLNKLRDENFGFPTLVRFSWKTSKDMISKEGGDIEWYDPKIEDKKQQNLLSMMNGEDKRGKICSLIKQAGLKRKIEF